MRSFTYPHVLPKRAMRKLIVLALVIGCGSKKTEVSPKEIIDEHRARLEELGAKLTKLESALPPDAELAPKGKLDPPLVFGRENGSVKGNTIVLMYEWLSDPVTKFDAGKVPPAALHFGLYWLKTLPSGDRGSNASMRATVEQAANTRYAIVLRRQEEVAPRLVDDRTFKAGFAVARLYVYDLVADKLVGALKIVAKTPDSISYKYDPNGNKNAEAERAMLQSLKDDREAKLGRALEGLGDAKWGY